MSRSGRRILHALRRIVRAVDLYSRELVTEHKVTGPQLVCLNALVELESVTATDLSRHVQLSTSNVVRILDRLEAKGLILRERQDTDRRRILASATLTGRELSAKAPYSDNHPLRKALKQLPGHDQEAVTGLLEKLVELMDARELSASPVLKVDGLGETSDPVDTSSGSEASSRNTGG